MSLGCVGHRLGSPVHLHISNLGCRRDAAQLHLVIFIIPELCQIKMCSCWRTGGQQGQGQGQGRQCMQSLQQPLHVMLQSNASAQHAGDSDGIMALHSAESLC